MSLSKAALHSSQPPAPNEALTGFLASFTAHRYRVPRCIKGSNGPADADLRAINGKLVFRKFTKTGAGQRKSTQPRIFGAGASNADVVETELNMMEEPLRGFPWMPRLF